MRKIIRKQKKQTKSRKDKVLFQIDKDDFKENHFIYPFRKIMTINRFFTKNVLNKPFDIK